MQNLNKAARLLSPPLIGVDPIEVLTLISLLRNLFRSLMAGCAPAPEDLHAYLTEPRRPLRQRLRENRVRKENAQHYTGDPAKLAETQDRTIAAIKSPACTVELIRGCYLDASEADKATEDFGD